MKLYLVQHGDALPNELDSRRPLSDQGRADVGRVAAFLANAGVRIPAVLHSGKKRAEQTAEILVASIGTSGKPERISGVDPLDAVSDFVPTINGWTGDTMIVGHLPFMAKLVSLLVTGNEEASVAAYRPGTVVELERNEGGSWSVAWMIHPELV